MQGVYILERDRQDRRFGHDALAKKWWSFFNFKLLHPLVDLTEGGCVFGAVYKWSKKAAGFQFRPPGAPKIVVAFRGTITKPGSFAGDLRLDLQILRNRLHTTARFRTAFDAVKKYVCDRGRENVWIAGHSLGAAMAMLAGRRMAEEGHFLEAHLFNPPFVSAPVDGIRDKKVKRGLHIATTPGGCRAGLGAQGQVQPLRVPQRLLRPAPVGSLPLCQSEGRSLFRLCGVFRQLPGDAANRRRKHCELRGASFDQ